MSTRENDLPDTLARWDTPSHWQWVSIAEVGKIVTGNTPPTKEQSNYGDEIPFVKPPELLDKGVWSAAEGLSKKGAQLGRVLPAGSVLVSCIGGLGKTGLAKVPVAFNQQINAVIFDERVVPEFGFYYAQTLKNWLYSVASATTLPIVNKGKFQRAPFPLAPLIEQTRIVAEIEKQFSRLDEAVANLKRVKANLKRYKAAVLKAAVEGKLTEEWRRTYLPAPTSRPGKFYTYAILCDDDSIYIGHTDDIERRWKEHRDGKGSDWTKEHKPVKIAHYEEYDTREEAAEREKWLKTGYGRKWIKRELAAGRTRQAGDVEPASELLKRILAERRAKRNGKSKYKEPNTPDVVNLLPLPESWTWATVEQVSYLVQYGSSAKTSEDPTGIPVLRMGNIVEGKLQIDDLKYLPKSHDEFPELLLEPGDVLFNRTNSAELVGKTAVYRGNPSPCSFASYLIRVRFVSGCVPEVVSYYLNSVFGRSWIKSVVSQQVGQANVNGAKLQALVIPLPPILEQQQIVGEVGRRTSVVEELETTAAANLQRTERLRQTILAMAFTGRLRIETRTDIDSSVLLGETIDESA